MTWMLGQNDELETRWLARSQDGKRQYEVSASGDRPRTAWRIRILRGEEIEDQSVILISEYEAKSAAEMLESRNPIDEAAMANERAHLNAIMTRGGKKWEFYGVIDQKQIWAYRPRNALHAYVIIYDYRQPNMGWTVTLRSWGKEKGGIRKLKIDTIANCESLEQAQDKVLRLG
jgi:hypothetical protein